jgi:hypothetical protein
VPSAGVANSLCAKLGKGAGATQAFINEVEAQAGKAISRESAGILIELARALSG